MRLAPAIRRYAPSALAFAVFVTLAGSTVQAMEFMAVKDIKPGMTGYAKTVIEGNTISTFNVKILGIMKDKGPSGDLILARFSGPVMDETGGIVHGMSGSPVYIDGKLVGAVAYGWGFADGKIGMITPIEQMVKLWNVPYEKYSGNPWENDRLIPMGTPLMAYGYEPGALDYMKKKMPQYKYQTYDTASVSSDNVKQPLVDGGSVAALLVDGDLKLGAVGTVTYTDKDHIVAFGHPFMKKGSVNYFMHNASILSVVKSIDSGFKLGSMGAEVGTVTEDRGAGIAGIEGKYAGGIPFNIHVRDLDTGAVRNAWVKIVEAEDMTPSLASSAVYNFISKTIDRSGEGTAYIRYEIIPKGKSLPAYTRDNMVYSAYGVSAKSVDEFYNVLDVLLNNRFINYKISAVNIDVGVTQAVKVAKIVDASANRVIVSPGDLITVNVKVKPFREPAFNKQILFKVPEDQAYGKATLEVRGGGVVPLPYLLEKQKYNLTDEIIQRLRHYKNFKDFYKKLQNTDTNNEIVVEILDTDLSMINNDGSKPDKGAKIEVPKDKLPGDIQPKDKASKIDDDGQSDQATIKTEYIVNGDGQFTLKVLPPAERDKELRKLAVKNKAKAEAKKKAAAHRNSFLSAIMSPDNSSSGNDGDTDDDGGDESDIARN